MTVAGVRSAVIWVKGGSSIRPDDYLFDPPHNPLIHQPSEDYDGVRPHKLAAWLKKFDQR